VRQFEFHPTRPGILLAGRRDGVVAVLDQESDVRTHSADVDMYPILGLSWLRTHPQCAMAGASHSGATCVVRYDESNPGVLDKHHLEPFPHLSSLSVNCTDDFFMTSGFRIDVALYDLMTGRRVNMFRGLHQNFVNIIRFAHQSPHMFATSSFDHTCKVWDLREPIRVNRPVRAFNTPTLNVMCCFSPDDRRVLCSGVDSALLQFGLDKPPGHDSSPTGGLEASSRSSFPIPAMNRDTNYRRSVYLADGGLVATAATNESLLRFYTAEAPHRHRGLIDFRNSLHNGHWQQQVTALPATAGLHRRGHAVTRQSAQPGAPQRSQASPSSPGAATPENAAEEWEATEFVQSLRCHPTDPRLLGVLLSTASPKPESFVSMVRIDR
jgi:WD40 repeat protein